MTAAGGPAPELRGPISYMARNGVAANLLMLFILVAGLFALRGLVQEVFPEISMDRVLVSVEYPGATPDEIEESIILKIEERIEGVEGLKHIRSTVSEGRGSVVAELNLGEDLNRALDDIKAQVDRIQTFPAGAERPEVSEVTNRQSVIRLVVYGDVSERTLKELAYRTEDALSALPEVSYVETTGVREYEISIEVPMRQLRALGLTLGDVSIAVRGGSLDLSAGSIDTRDEEVRIRTTGQNYTQKDFEEIIVLSRADGTVVRLGDIAEVRDGFREVDLTGRYRGRPAVYVEVFRTADEKVLEIVDAVERHLEEEAIPSLPAGVGLEVWNNDADILKSRLGLLIKNGFLGLTLVLLALALFLEIRLAFWVAVGIAVSFVGTFAVMSVLGVSINLMSLFAFILAIGIVVDDAIVVGENIYAEREKGSRGVPASIRGARRVTRPVIFAVMTTMVAFCPLFFIPSSIGRIIGEIPIIVMSVLMFSLIESLLVLPNHLSHLPDRGGGSTPRRPHLIGRIQSRVESGLQRFIAGPLDRGLRLATGRPAVVIASGVAMIIVCVAMIPAGIIKVDFMPTVEGDLVTASLEMPEGTPVHRTTGVARTLETAGYRALERLASSADEDVETLLAGVNVTVGLPARRSGPGGGAAGAASPRANVAAVEFKLADPEERSVSATDFQQEWREEVGSLPEAKSLGITAELIGFGAPVHVELSHPDPGQLALMGETLMARLHEFAGVFDIQADQDQGLREIRLDLLPGARTLGLTLENLARQVRSAFFGNEALRVQRGREDMRVYVRLPEEERNAIADVESYQVRDAGRRRGSARPGGVGALRRLAHDDTAQGRPAGPHRDRRREHRRGDRRRGHRPPRSLGPARAGGAEPGADLLLRGGATGTGRVVRRAGERLRPGAAGDLRAAGHPLRLLHKAADHHGGHSLRDHRGRARPRDPRPPDGDHVAFRRDRPERRGGERFAGHDRLHRGAPAPRHVRPGSHHRGGEGALPSDLPHLGDDLPGRGAARVRDQHPGPVPDPDGGVAGVRDPLRDRRAHDDRAGAGDGAVPGGGGVGSRVAGAFRPATQNRDVTVTRKLRDAPGFRSWTSTYSACSRFATLV